MYRCKLCSARVLPPCGKPFTAYQCTSLERSIRPVQRWEQLPLHLMIPGAFFSSMEDSAMLTHNDHRRGIQCLTFITGTYSGLLAACGLCWRMRLRGDSHPPAGRPRGAPLLWTGLESRLPRATVWATLVVAPRGPPTVMCRCPPTLI